MRQSKSEGALFCSSGSSSISTSSSGSVSSRMSNSSDDTERKSAEGFRRRNFIQARSETSAFSSLKEIFRTSHSSNGTGKPIGETNQGQVWLSDEARIKLRDRSHVAARAQRACDLEGVQLPRRAQLVLGCSLHATSGPTRSRLRQVHDANGKELVSLCWSGHLSDKTPAVEDHF